METILAVEHTCVVSLLIALSAEFLSKAVAGSHVSAAFFSLIGCFCVKLRRVLRFDVQVSIL